MIFIFQMSRNSTNLIIKYFQVNFTTTLFALIRENLKINVRESSEMDQADIELRTTIIKCWPHTKRDKIDLLVPTPKGKHLKNRK